MVDSQQPAQTRRETPRQSGVFFVISGRIEADGSAQVDVIFAFAWTETYGTHGQYIVLFIRQTIGLLWLQPDLLRPRHPLPCSSASQRRRALFIARALARQEADRASLEYGPRDVVAMEMREVAETLKSMVESE